MNGLEQLLPFVLIALVFWFLLIRPQRKRQAELAQTQNALEVGDEVMLGAGIVGRVAEAGGEFVHVEIAPGVPMKVARQAIVRVLVPEDTWTEDSLTEDVDGAQPGHGDDTAFDVHDDTPRDGDEPRRDGTL